MQIIEKTHNSTVNPMYDLLVVLMDCQKPCLFEPGLVCSTACVCCVVRAYIECLCV